MVLGGVAALAVVLLVGASLLADGPRIETPVAIPTYTPPRSTQTDAPTEPTQVPTQVPSAQPSAEPTTPPKPTLDRSLKTNTVYRVGRLPSLNCRAGDASIYSHGELKALILKTGKCMDRAWGPLLLKQGIPWIPAKYAIAAKRGRGACGDYPSPGNMVPYYCPRNHTIYASTSAMSRGNGNSAGYGELVQWNGGIISMMAHEYGHHVQNISGLLNAHWSRRLESSSQSGRLGLDRRIELQATCFGGMFMRSVHRSYPISTTNRNRLFWFYSRLGDHPGYPRDHGSPVNNHRWFRQGWERNHSFQCNTWLASSSATS
ncbi:hypothetical protein GCM10009560_58450 [Nonomuraea longicatena]|uniref:Peptidase n=1 Tax=Nonomuraea longicatena TaxID=83682 RepID=A0ABP4B729_9ACTN